MPGETGLSYHPNASLHTQEETAYSKRIRPSLPGPTPHVWGMLMDYWQVPASLAVTWWQALGRSHHTRALAVRQAVLLFDAAPVAEVYSLVYPTFKG